MVVDYVCWSKYRSPLVQIERRVKFKKITAKKKGTFKFLYILKPKSIPLPKNVPSFDRLIK